MPLLSVVLLLILTPSLASAWCERVPKRMAPTVADAHRVIENEARFLNSPVPAFTCREENRLFWFCSDGGSCSRPDDGGVLLGPQGSQLAPGFEGYYRSIPDGREYRCDAAFGCRPAH